MWDWPCGNCQHYFQIIAATSVLSFECCCTFSSLALMVLLFVINLCLWIGCLSSPVNVEKFYSIVKSLPVTSDKVTIHSYQEMYGLFLLPFIKERHSRDKTIKFFEIGMGCDGNKFYGGSVEIWNNVFSAKDELWTADYQGGCIEKARADGKLYNFRTMVGDQANITTLNRWMNESGGEFDIIVDDGGHTNPQIYNTVYTLWKHLKPGGLYFIEDMQIGRNPGFNVEPIMSDVVRDWIEQLIINEPYTKYTHKIMPHVKSIFCQSEACIIMKCGEKDLGRCHHERVAEAIAARNKKQQKQQQGGGGKKN